MLVPFSAGVCAGSRHQPCDAQRKKGAFLPVPSLRCEETFPEVPPSFPACLQNPLSTSLTKTSSRVITQPIAGAGSGSKRHNLLSRLSHLEVRSASPEARDCARGESGDMVKTQIPSGRREKKRVSRVHSLQLVPRSFDSGLTLFGLLSQNIVGWVASKSRTVPSHGSGSCVVQDEGTSRFAVW